MVTLSPQSEDGSSTCSSNIAEGSGEDRGVLPRVACWRRYYDLLLAAGRSSRFIRFASVPFSSDAIRTTKMETNEIVRVRVYERIESLQNTESITVILSIIIVIYLSIYLVSLRHSTLLLFCIPFKR